MYRHLKVIAIAPVLNEELKIGHVVRRTPRTLSTRCWSSTTAPLTARPRSRKLRRDRAADGPHARRRRRAAGRLRYAVEHGYDVAVVMAGNNKDAPEEIPLLLDPIAEAGRLRPGLALPEARRQLRPDAALPADRHPGAPAALLAGRAPPRHRVHQRLPRGPPALLTDPRLDLDQAWLDEYELEPYLYLARSSSAIGRPKSRSPRCTRPGSWDRPR